MKLGLWNVPLRTILQTVCNLVIYLIADISDIQRNTVYRCRKLLQQGVHFQHKNYGVIGRSTVAK